MAKKKKDMINRNQKRAVIYIRYSSHNQTEGYSIEYQLEQARKYAERQGYTIVGEYIDTAKTAKRTAGRDELFKMIDDAGKDLFDMIIVFSFNRAFRNTRDALNVHFDLMEKYGIPVHSVIEPIDMTTAHGKFSATNLFAMHELSSDITAEHVKAAMYYAVQQGYYMGGKVPFGYKLVGTGEFTKGRERKRFVIDPENAPIVRQIFDMYNSGVGTMAIANMLCEIGAVAPNGKQFSPHHIRAIVTFEGYTGISTHHFKGYDPLITDKMYPQIISRDAYKIAVEEYKKRTKKYGPRYTGKDYYYYFTGKSQCGKCGKYMTVNSTNNMKNRYYLCSTVRSAGERCKNTSIRVEKVDEAIMNAIYKHILSDKAIENVAKEVFANAQKVKKPEIDVNALKKRETEIKKALKSLAEKLVFNKIPEEIVNEMTDEYTKELEQIERQIFNAQQETEPITEKSVVSFLKSLQHLDKKDIHSTKIIFDTFVENVVFVEDKLTVSLIVPPMLNRGATGRANAPLYNKPIIIEL